MNAVPVFYPDGTIPCYNVPGTVHDSMVAIFGNIHDKLEAIFNSCCWCCIVDLAFASNNYPFLIKSEKSSGDMTLNQMGLAA